MSSLGHSWIDWALSRPRRVIALMISTTVVAVVLATAPTLVPGGLGPLSKIAVDVDPENMLDSDEPVRVFHDESKKRFGLNDAVVVGIINEKHPEGVFNAQTLSKLHRLTAAGKLLEGVVPGDVMSLSTVDSIENAGPGTVSFSWLMENPPANDEEAAQIRARAERIPFLRDTLFSADAKAIVVYLPLTDKHFAHDVAGAMQAEIDKLERGDDRFHIAGLPVAEETFGVEMFVQMAISAPAAMLVIFLLMWVFFRRVIVIVAPMIVAMVTVFTTMGLLVITGNTIHIMSSMIPIFIMPIAVLDAVHIISDFFDRFDPKADRKATIESVMRHLFSPMLFTSLTTAAGFASLALTPIPPVQVFGIFVAIGVVLAWLWTILFIPAFLVVLSPKRLEGFGRKLKGLPDEPAIGFLAKLNLFTFRRARLIILAAVVAMAGAAYGISKIVINDNPTRWFEEDHPIRIADRELNAHFGGTYDAFLALEYAPEVYQPEAYGVSLNQQVAAFRAASSQAFAGLVIALEADTGPDAVASLESQEDRLREARTRAATPAERAAFDAGLTFLAEQFDELESDANPTEASSDPAAAGSATPAPAAPGAAGARAKVVERAKQRAAEIDAVFGAVPAAIIKVTQSAPANAAVFRSELTRALGELASPAQQPLAAYLGASAQSDEVFKQPEMLAYIEALQAHLQLDPTVGKSSSLADIVKTVHRDLVSGTEEDYRLPGTATVVAQTLDQYLSSHRKDDLWHFVTPDYQRAVIWLQLTSGDNQKMEAVVAEAQAYLSTHPAPLRVGAPKWFGLTYINVVWQERMVSGMLKSFLGSFVIVFVLMVLLFRSVLWGSLAMIPLTLTVAVIYGAIGFVGKDYDMPVAVLSSLSLGLAVDYAIHFLARSRDLVALHGSWGAARGAVFGEPSRAIARNIVVVGMGFLPLLLAPLVPYQTVGILIAAILILAGAASLILLPAHIAVLERFLFPAKRK